MRRKPFVATILLVLVCALALAGAALAGTGGFAPPTPRSPNAQRTNDAYYLILAFTGAIFLLVETALVVFVIRFRSRGRPRTVEGPQIRGHTRLEIIWTAIPVVILAAITGFVFYKLPGIKNVPAANAAGGRIEIGVEAHQFYWQFRYPDGSTSVDELTVPVDRNVHLTLTSPDVAHSWWVPSLGGKIDVIPGRTNHTWFRAQQNGVYRIRCAELCGIQHAVMLGFVRVVPQSDYASFLGARHAKTADLARETYQGVCAKCHGFKGEGGIGPKLAGSAGLNDRTALAKTIRNGIGMMPPVGRTWDSRQLNAVITYLQKHVASSAGGAAGGG